MTEFSDAARAHYRSTPFSADTPNRIRAAFDAGAAHALATHTCPAEPERLTDPDDPRIRDGALVTITFDSSAPDRTTTYQYRIGSDSFAGSVQHVRDCVRCADVRLLAEAPEPHPDDAILHVLAVYGHDGNILADLRDEGFDIVRADR